MPTATSSRVPNPALLVAAGALAGFAAGWFAGRAGAPTKTPEAPAPAAAAFVPPLHDAAVGETIRLRRGTTEFAFRVAEATDDFVRVELVQTRLGGAAPGETPPEATSFHWARDGYGVPEGFVVRRVVPDRIEVAGRSWDCWRLQCHSRNGLRFYWVTDAVPVHGVLRIAPDNDSDGAPDRGVEADLVPEAIEGGSR